MSELLAPAGSMEALRAAIANGCDAVYLGMQHFGARAYSSNFDEESVAWAVAYAHLRGVKVYVTVNTIVYEDELAEVKALLRHLNEIGVDGVIAQDLAVLRYIAENFQDMEPHCSTQMGIDDLEATLLVREMGAKRVVLARELGIERVKEIRRKSGVAVEVFVHGALCISFSGNCIMSGMTGNRLGNRGRCIGTCRKLFTITNTTTGELLGRNYILSTKDLNTIDFVDQLDGIDSLKIEGRMKEPIYVANVVSRYRMALDGVATSDDKEKLNRTFNRSFTKGYLFGEDRRDITNTTKPNNFGFEIGKICSVRKGTYGIALSRPLRQNDVICIRHDDCDVNLSVAKLYDGNGMLINGSETTCYIRIKERLSVGDVVYKTKDLAYEKELEARLTGEFRRFPLDFAVYAYPGAPLVVDARGFGLNCTYEGDDLLSEAINRPTTRDDVVKQLSRLNETVFCLGEVTYEDCGAFIPAKMLNAARKKIVAELCAQRLAGKSRRVKEPAPRKPIAFTPVAPYLSAAVTTPEQFEACKQCGIEVVYFDNIVPRNNNVYQDREGELLIGGLGGIYRYRQTNPFVTDYSLNIVNAESCYEMHRLGAKRVTLSYELNESQLSALLSVYQRENGGLPALEMIVYGRAPLLVTKYCPLKKMGQCGMCRTNTYEIEDEFGTFPVVPHEDCTTTILNGKFLNLLDEMPGIRGVEAFRLNFTTETPDEVRAVIAKARGKLDGSLSTSAFNSETDTRGHFHKEIL